MSYRVAVDAGGTFTDLVGVHEDGTILVHKTPSNPSAPESAVLAGLAGLAEKAGLTLEELLGACRVLIHGSTVALNTLIQHRGAVTGLLATEGHEDSLVIRLGHKEDGHRWDFRYPPAAPLVPGHLRLGVRERVLADGTVHTPLDEAHLHEQIEILRAEGVEAVAVSCLWAFARPDHERRVCELVTRALPECYVSLSTQVLPRIGEYMRTSTTAVNAYIGPVLRNYMDRVADVLAGRGFDGALYFMQSNGGVATREVLGERPVMALNSGPAGGPVAALWFGRLDGRSDVISIDMGGTSFDVCLVKDGFPDVVTDLDVARYRVGLPMVNVTSIGAGGGSIARIDERGVMRVGPESAESYPGPACYGRGGVRPTVTDALVVLGYLSEEGLLGGDMPLDAAAATEVIRTEIAEPAGLNVLEAARGIIEVTTANMVEGIRIASIERGHDPRQFLLVVGGGAGPAFAGAVGRALGFERVIVPDVAGGLCAFGEAIADLRYDSVRAYPTTLSSFDCARANALLAEMEAEGSAALGSTIEDGAVVRVERTAEMKYVDQIHYCEVDVPGGVMTEAAVQVLRERFDKRHEDLYTYAEPDNEAELLTLRATSVVERATAPARRTADRERSERQERTRPVYMESTARPTSTPIVAGGDMRAGEPLHGPAVVELETTTIVVGVGETLTRDERGFSVLTLAP